ncbi:hypothetical protein PINS_up002770 [Pythium insidiosum]|nr:hypothetical protein PINS_up002770 [Pythium insidiosum]
MSFGKTNYRNGGTRGGADQFKWDDVKNDKYRENYLGHSLHAPVGRWQKGKDLTWYNKLSREDRAAALKAEIALAKQRDQELMDQALGIAPKRRVEPTGPLEAAEVKELLKRGASDREGLDGERVEGVGAAPAPSGYDTRPKKTMAEKYEESLAKGGDERSIYALPGTTGTGTGDRPSGDDAARREEKARKKAAKKLLKKEKKEKKKERKERRRRDDDKEHESDRRGRDRDRKRRALVTHAVAVVVTIVFAIRVSSNAKRRSTPFPFSKRRSLPSTLSFTLSG